MHGFRLLWECAILHDSRHTIFGFDHKADVNAARLTYRVLWDESLPEEKAGRMGMGLHYAFGAMLGMLYQACDGGGNHGAIFGALLWLCADEIPISASGIFNPFAKSAASHASALAAHVVFGFVTAKTLRVLQSQAYSSHA